MKQKLLQLICACKNFPYSMKFQIEKDGYLLFFLNKKNFIKKKLVKKTASKIFCIFQKIMLIYEIKHFINFKRLKIIFFTSLQKIKIDLEFFF